MKKIIILLILFVFISCAKAPEQNTEETVQVEIAGEKPDVTESPISVDEPSIEDTPMEDPVIEETATISNPELAGNPNPKQEIIGTPQCCNHPYWHKLYRATSDDGLTWKSDGMMLVDSASVPAVIRKDSKFILYYVNGKIDTFDCSISDDGINFEYGDCRIYGFTGQKAWDPSVVKTEEGYRLYYFSPEQMMHAGNKILSAVSADGINWLQEEGIRFEHQGILDPVVIKIGEKWMMYTWYGADGPPQDATIVIAESSDGLEFEKIKELKAGGGIPDVVLLNNGKYAIYFCDAGIRVMTSSDGITFSDKQLAYDPKTGESVCDPAVIKTDEGWVMYYKKAGRA